MLPILKVEQMNVEYVYSKLMGKKFENFDKLIFKEGQRPKADEVPAVKAEEKATDAE